MILEYLQHVTTDDVDEAVESFRSAFLPMHCKPMGGKFYRKGINDLRREIMLFPETGNKYAVLDPFQRTVNLPKVIVPVYPQIGDLVSVIGDDEN